MGTRWARAGSSAALIVWWAGAAAADVRVERGLGGVIPAGGVDVIAVTVSGERATRGVVTAGGPAVPFELAAGGAVTVRLGRDVRSGLAVGEMGPIAVEVRGDGVAWRGEALGARVVARPFVVVATDVAALVQTGSTRLGDGEVIALSVDRLPSEWAAYEGVGAVLLDGAAAEGLGAAQRVALRRYVARGGTACVLRGGGLECAAGAALPVPPEIPPSADGVVEHALARWALVAAGATSILLLAFARRLRVLCVAVPLVVAWVPLRWAAPPEVRASGVQIVGGDEDQVIGRVAIVAPLGGSAGLDEGAWWIRGERAELGPLEVNGPLGPGVWRVDGFARPERAAWRAKLPTVQRGPVALPW